MSKNSYFTSGFWGVARMNFDRILRIWSQTIFPPLITTVLYILVFGYSIGRAIPPKDGITYLEFLIPGLVMMSVIMNAYSNAAFSFFISRLQKWIEELLVAPIGNVELILGFLVGGVVRGLIVATLIILVGFLIADVFILHWILVFILLILTSTAFSLAGFLNALFAKTFDGVNFVPTFLLTPLTFLGGVFYSLERLPPVWQKITLFNPVFWIISGFREAFYGISEVPLILPIGFLVGMIVILFVLALYFVKKGLNIRS